MTLGDERARQAGQFQRQAMSLRRGLEVGAVDILHIAGLDRSHDMIEAASVRRVDRGGTQSRSLDPVLHRLACLRLDPVQGVAHARQTAQVVGPAQQGPGQQAG